VRAGLDPDLASCRASNHQGALAYAANIDSAVPGGRQCLILSMRCWMLTPLGAIESP